MLNAKIRRLNLFKIILIFLLVLQVIPFLHAENCIRGVEVQIGTYEKDQDSSYVRSDYQINTRDEFIREGDYLFIENITAVISPNCQRDLEDICIKTKSPSQSWFKQHMCVNLIVRNLSYQYDYIIQRKNIFV